MERNESVQIQKAAWVAEQVKRQREQEDAERERLKEEQLILEEMKRNLDDDIQQSKELQRYNEACEADIKEQVYGLHGISNDKLFGMQAYKNAYFQGLSLGLFLLSVALTAFAGWYYGIASQMFMYLMMCTAVEGALLSQEGRRGKVLDGICKFLYLLVFPTMAAAFIMYEFKFTAFVMVLMISVLVLAVALVLGTMAYFFYNPYRSSKKFVRRAKSDLKELHQDSIQAVKKNEKKRKREEAKAEKAEQKAEAKRIRQEKMQAFTAKVKEKFHKEKQGETEVKTIEKIEEKNEEVSLEEVNVTG